MHVTPCKEDICFECIITLLKDGIISKVDDDPRDKLVFRVSRLIFDFEKLKTKSLISVYVFS